eukprot:1978754-Rhodomonas_salina.1
MAGTCSTFVSGRYDDPLVRANTLANQENAVRSKSELELLKLIEELCTRMDLTGGIPKAAADMGRKFLAARERDGKKSRPVKEAVVAACVYCACDEQGVRRTVKEMLARANCAPKKFNHALKLAAPLQRTHGPLDAAGRACALLPRFCSRL